MRRLMVAALSLCAVCGLSAAAHGALYSVSFTGQDDLTALVARGAVVRHLGAGEAVVEGDIEFADRLEAAGVPHARLADPARGEVIFLCYPRSSGDNLSDLGRVLWSEPRGAILVAAPPERVDDLREACFHARPLPAAIEVASWFDDRPPGHVSTRAAAGEAAVRGLVEDVLEAVSPDSLMAHVDRLSRWGDGSARSRFVLREDCLTESRPYIERCLAQYLPPGAPVDTQRFWVAGHSCENDTLVIDHPADNIVGVLPGNGRLGGCYIVCAHYDATAARSFSGDAMWWCDNPAPGADDNATGVGVVLEAARVLSGVEFPFDVRFILFSGEELGLLGSTAYADSAAAAGDTIYAVLNVDMVAYKASGAAPDTCHLVTNPGTMWLADWIVDTAAEYSGYFDGLDVTRIDRALAYSDHAPFWMKGYDGLVAIEHWNAGSRNPFYHAVGDVLGTLSESQYAHVGRLLSASLARLVDTESTINLAVFPGDASFDPALPTMGDRVDVSVKVHIFGPEEFVDMRLEVWDGDPGRGTLLSSFDAARVMGGGEVVRHEFSWDVSGDDLGEHDVTLVVEAEGTTELTKSDNQAVAHVKITDPNNLFVLRHFAYPNPGRPEELNIRYELSRSGAAVYIEVFDITGQLLGEFVKGIEDAEPVTQPGWNTVALDSFGGLAERLAGGVYVYRLRVYAEGGSGSADTVTGKFAVVR